MSYRTRKGKTSQTLTENERERENEIPTQKQAGTVVDNQERYDVYQLTKVKAPNFLSETLKCLGEHPALAGEMELAHIITQAMLQHACWACGGVGHNHERCGAKARFLKIAAEVERGFERIVSDGLKDLLNEYTPLTLGDAYLNRFRVQQQALQTMTNKKIKEIEERLAEVE